MAHEILKQLDKSDIAKQMRVDVLLDSTDFIKRYAESVECFLKSRSIPYGDDGAEFLTGSYWQYCRQKYF